MIDGLIDDSLKCVVKLYMSFSADGVHIGQVDLKDKWRNIKGPDDD